MTQVQIELLIEAGSAPKTLGEVKQSIKDVNKALLDIPFGSKAFRDLDEVLKQNKETVRNLKKEFDTMQNVSIFAKNLSGAFGLATSAISLFGDETSETAKTIQKVVSALALVQSIQQFTEGLKLAESANKALNASLLTNPYVLMAAAVVAAAAALYIFSTGEEDTKHKTEELNKELSKQTDLYTYLSNSINNKFEVQKSATKDAVELAKLDIQQTKEQIKNVDEQTVKLLAQLRVRKLTEDEAKKLKELADERNKLLAEEQVAINNLAFAEQDAVKKRREDAERDRKAAEERRKQRETELNEIADTQQKFSNENLKGLEKRIEDADFAFEKEADAYRKAGIKEAAITELRNQKIKEVTDKYNEEKLKEAEAANQRNNNAIIKAAELDIVAAKQAGQKTLELQINLELQKRTFLLQNTNLTEQERQNIIKESELRIQQLKKDSAAAQLQTEKEKFKAEINEAQSYVSAIGNTLSQLGSLITEGVRQQTDERIAEYTREKDAAVSLYDERLKQNLISKSEYDNLVAAQERELKKKKNKELKKQFIAQKTVAIINATINTAASVIQALSSMPPPASYVFAALNGALGAAQIGVIASQKPPQEFARGGVFQAAGGGMVSGLGSGTSDSINARLSNGESIINARSTSAFAPILSAMNELGGGIRFNGQPSVITNPSGIASNKTEETATPTHISVSISEAEISKVQNKVQRVNVRSTF